METRTDQQSGRRSILVVDGDAQIQRLLDLSLRNAGFEVKTVATAPEALKWLAAQRPDLVVSEAKLADGPDGFELCRTIKKRPDGAAIAFLFLSEQTVENKLRGIEAGADDFLGKPLYVQEVVAHARSLLQRRERDRLDAAARGDEKFGGHLEDFPLVDLLRAIETNHKSGVVTLTAPGGARGEIYFRDGVVVDAEAGRLSGVDAVCRLFAWSQATFEIEWKGIRRRDAVSMESGALLIEALRRLDEWKRLLTEVPPLETIFEVDYHLLAERLAEIPDEVNAILRLFDGQRSFIQVIDDCGLADLDALAVIGKLFREAIIRDVRARPAPSDAPGADMESWIADAAGPFRAQPSRPRRDLFGAMPEAGSGVHLRPTAPVEPLDEAAANVPVAIERKERFTDRLIAEGAAAPPPRAPLAAAETTQLGLGLAPPPAARAPLAAAETTQLGLGLPPPPVAAAPRAPVLAAETTNQGLGAPVPALSTKPGFAAVTPPAPPPPRVARDVLTDVTPALRDVAADLRASADGVPHLVPLRTPEPAIVIPVAPGAEAAPAAAAASGAAAEQRPVAGEILARPPAARGLEPALASVTTLDDGARSRTTAPSGVDPSGKRTTAPGMGPARKVEVEKGAPTVASGEVVASAAKVEEARPVRKIILDPEIPADDAAPATSARWIKRVGIGVGMAMAVGLVWFAFANTGRKRQHEVVAVAEKQAAPQAAKPAPEPPTAGGGDAAKATTPDAGTAANAGPARKVTPLDERSADPKMARELPAQFPPLLAGCRQAFTEKRAKDAEAACLAAKEANPDSAEACAMLGHALFGRKKRREALVWAERAVELDPKQADAYVIIGGVKQAADDIVAAKAAYQKYLELAPQGQYAADVRAIVDSL